MDYIESEACGFPRGTFPMKMSGHEIHLLHNDAHETKDERFQMHITLHCARCDEEKTVRGRLPHSFDDYNYAAAAAKLVVLGRFRKKCSGMPHRTYVGP